MLTVKDLTKIYTNGVTSVTALNNISFTLEDKGVVFITGKSGCGKTTLLSIIGGLDNATKGTVICDGNDLSRFNNKDFDNYRNTYLGFIFQDYCLIDDLNIAQNIEIAINLEGEEISTKEKEQLVDETLISVDLDPQIKNRYPKELSGGQKQRIAIARALIKNPKLILADEPTGNLDSKTSKKILQLLKKLSKDRLVLIVSHNTDDARQYADRIIEIADGEIISDICRSQENTEEMTIENGVLTLPHSGNLTQEQLLEINSSLQSEQISHITQHTLGFETTKNIEISNKHVNIEPKRMKFHNALKLSKHFIKKRWLASCVTIFVTSLLVFILGLSQFLIQFQEESTISEVMIKADETDMLIYKGYYYDDTLQQDNYVKISDEDIQKIKDSGYTGNVYELYYDPFCYSEYKAESGNILDTHKYLKGKWISESLGTLNCDTEYLTNKFGVNGKLNVLAGTLDDKPYGIIITDYMAESINQLVFKGQQTYENIVGKNINYRNYVNAIIDTDYEEKYADLFKYIEDTSIGIDRNVDKTHFKNRFMQFVQDVQKYYGIAYSVNPNFKNDICTYNYSLASLHYSTLFAEGFSISKDSFMVNLASSILSDNEIAMEYDIFNTKFGRFYGFYDEDTYQDFTPITLTINKYDDSNHTNLVYSKEVIIKKLLPTTYANWTNANSNMFYAGNDLYDLIKSNSKYVHGLYLDDATQLNTFYSIITDNAYNVQSPIFASISVVGDIVEIFDNLFWIICVGISGVCLLLLISYAYGNIKKKYYEIGVLKALGATTNNVGFLFSLQTILAGILICILSNTALLLLCQPINVIISEKLLTFISNNDLGPLTILQANPLTIIINTLVILLVTTLTCIIPLIKLHHIKPKNIIANKD